MSITLRMEPELRAAAARLASRLTALFAAEMDRLHGASRPIDEMSGLGQEQLAQAALKVIEQAGARLTPDELRARLNASFAPVIDRLVAGGQSFHINRKKS